MKRLIILLIIFFSVGQDAFAQYSAKFDSVKAYTNQYYGTGLHLNQYNIMYSGDSVLITDSKIVTQFFSELSVMKKKSTPYNLKKVRKDFTSESMNVRAVFVFYNGTKKTIVGISPQPLMFINRTVFEKKDIALENIVKPSKELYKNLFPTKEEIINRN